jgi:inner membrane protein
MATDKMVGSPCFIKLPSWTSPGEVPGLPGFPHLLPPLSLHLCYTYSTLCWERLLHPSSHLIVSWLVGQHLPERRDRLLVAYAGVAPDLDGLSLLAGVDAYGQWHHVLTHGVVGATLVTICATSLAKDRVRVALLALVAFHGHLLCDFFGSGYGWGITYWFPFSRHAYLAPIQWDLNAWPNVAATAVALALSGWLALRHGHSVAETVVPRRWDAVIVETLRNRFGRTQPLRQATTE